jgi:hypothetical protein
MPRCTIDHTTRPGRHVTIESMPRAPFPFFAFLLTVAAASGETAVLECTADGWVAIPMRVAPDTRSRDLRIDREHRALLDFRTSHIEGWRISRAILMVHLSRGEPPASLQLTGLSAAWHEASDAKTFRGVIPPHLTGTTRILLDRQPHGWLASKLEPAAVEALAARRIHGFLLGAPSAQRELRIASRETLDTAPYLVVEGAARRR